MSNFDREMMHRALVQRVNDLVSLTGSDGLGNLNMRGDGDQVLSHLTHVTIVNVLH